jgi:hypothetical protein
MEFKPVRRLVIGHDQHGKAVALSDGALTPKQRGPGGNGVTNLWVTGESPVELTGAADKAAAHVGVPPPANGTVFRIVDFPPAPASAAAPHVDHDKVLIAMGIDPATQGHARHQNTHRTRTIVDSAGHQPCLGQQQRQDLPHRLRPDRRQAAGRLAATLEAIAASQGPDPKWPAR